MISILKTIVNIENYLENFESILSGIAIRNN